MSIKEEIKGREIYLRNKTQKIIIILPNKDEQENQNNNLKRPIRLTLKHQNRNLKIMTYNSQKLNNELLFSKQEIQKNPEQMQILNTLKNGRTINISSFKKNNVFNPLNRITKTINSNDSKYSKTLNKFHLYPKKNKNYINFVDRNKIRNIKLTTLNIFHQYLNEKSISPKENILKSEFFDNIDSEMNSKRNQKKSKIEFNLYSNNSSKISKSHFKNRLRKLTLNELMDINPYHYVPSKVKFSKVIEMGLISEKLGDMDSGITHHIVKNNVNFFRDKSSKKSKNNRVIDTFQVSYNKNLLHKSGLVWRILQKFYVRRKGINPSFKQACKFKAYTELWKYHSMIIEKLLVNYGKFKWFLEKEKFMREEVFTEFIECKKLESEIKGEITFAKKVFLAFDDTGIGIINIKLFFLVMEITSKYYNILEKINFICDLVEEF